MLRLNWLKTKCYPKEMWAEASAGVDVWQAYGRTETTGQPNTSTELRLTWIGIAMFGFRSFAANTHPCDHTQHALSDTGEERIV